MNGPVSIRLRNPTRFRREYRADLEIDGVVVGRVERAQSGKMLGYRAAEYRAFVGAVLLAAGPTLSDVKYDLASVDPAALRAEINDALDRIERPRILS